MVLDLTAQLDREFTERSKIEALLRELLDAKRNRKSEQLSADQLAYIINHAEDAVICVDEDLLPLLEKVADRLGHTPTICRTSYVHPRLLEDFTANKLARTLAPLVRRRLRQHKSRDDIAVEALRLIEPVVARYLGTTQAKRRA